MIVDILDQVLRQSQWVKRLVEKEEVQATNAMSRHRPGSTTTPSSSRHDPDRREYSNRYTVQVVQAEQG